MRTVRLADPTDFEAWRKDVRSLLAERIPPGEVVWEEGEGTGDLFAGAPAAPIPKEAAAAKVTVPKAFPDIARRVICHRSPDRLRWLYQLLWDMQTDRAAMQDPLNEAAQWVRNADKALRRDIHKMHAFVRFRKVGDRDGREVFSSWFEPDHRIVRLAAPFFMRRFTGMDWTILTPDGCASWDGTQLMFAEGVDRSAAPPEDVVEDQWRTYYASIFNPARLKVDAMLSEMPAKYWKNLPEAGLIPELIRGAGERSRSLAEQPASAPNALAGRVGHFFGPDRETDLQTISGVRQASMACDRCALRDCATQTVFGEGPEKARLMIVGEQPGDHEDIQGRPFVGPAGQLLDRALAEAGVDRRKAYLTNAVKHFKFTPRGKRRMHQKPNAGEIDTCRFWLGLERDLVRPSVILTLGATALRGVFGRAVPLKDVRGGSVQLEDGARLVAAVHPSYILRLPDAGRANEAYDGLVQDIRRAALMLDA